MFSACTCVCVCVCVGWYMQFSVASPTAWRFRHALLPWFCSHISHILCWTLYLFPLSGLRPLYSISSWTPPPGGPTGSSNSACPQQNSSSAPHCPAPVPSSGPPPPSAAPRLSGLVPPLVFAGPSLPRECQEYTSRRPCLRLIPQEQLLRRGF